MITRGDVITLEPPRRLMTSSPVMILLETFLGKSKPRTAELVFMKFGRGTMPLEPSRKSYFLISYSH
jgi:hypothetical protein